MEHILHSMDLSKEVSESFWWMENAYEHSLMGTTDTWFLPNQEILVKVNLANACTSFSFACINKAFLFIWASLN